ncbi:7-cyano-7-deazaguanine/7-aminomethyl-7-deazaguanine transporter [Desulfogranum mediterraneum]|uniref:7-cyano-7-deazaguanine/7-aminomethyl-7- deazaguanine transporter n=1 Tax=Desulfogranum mediterraneum TaxID=160661 RepID=UPI000409BD57|nr:7-cyano-7-deazaguanine/7-aminomethyl-7-deazaguanine transporter [Desulfogranum mediterraneum]
MLALTQAQRNRAISILAALHILILAASNYLVQIPFQLFGIHTTWGTFSFPFVYLATDLTVRIFGGAEARRIIFRVMLPALLFSYLISVLFFEGRYQGVTSLAGFNTFVFRIAFASFAAYTVGQLADVKVFARLRRHPSWWVAPAASTVLGNLLDTAIFFSVAFWASSDAFMASHWPEIGAVDYGFKLLVSIVLFLPLYGLLLRALTDKLLTAPAAKVVL